VTGHREVVFVGGTPFSGVEAAANLLADRQGATPVPLAAHFHSDAWGLPALLHGRIGLADFTERIRELEIAERISAERLDGALETLRAGYHMDPLQSCRELFWTLIGELVPDPGDDPLVEASPGNLAEGQTLMRLVPGARFVHVVRDGRDVAAAAIESGTVGVSRLPGAVEWWAGELRVIERGVRGEEDGTRYGIPQERLTVVVLDELEPHPANPEPGAWRSQVHGPARWWASRRYDRTLGELEAEGNHAAAALRAAYERSD
jgi:hypothetical protein